MVVLVVLLLFLMLLLSPRQVYPWAVAIAVPICVWLWWIISRPLPISSNWGALDRAFLIIALLVGMLPALGRFLVDVGGRDVVPRPDLDWKPTQASCTVVLIWGSAWLLTPAVPVLVGATNFVSVGLLLSLAMLGMAARTSRNQELFTVAGTALITGIIAALIWPMIVVDAAEKKASGQPYCMVVAHGSVYRTVIKMLDLTPTIMRGQESSGTALNYHAQLLIAGEKRRNWSYTNLDFTDEAREQHPPTCAVQVHFAHDLPWL